MTKIDYEKKARIYAERHGIISYKISGRFLIYYQNYNNNEFINGKWRKNPTTYKRTVDLANMTVKSEQLQRMNREGWKNV